MSLIADIFNAAAFSAVELTASVNVVPNAYGKLQQLDLMPAVGIPTTDVAVEYVNGQLNLLPTRPRGGTQTFGTPTRRNQRVFRTFHIPHDDFVAADDVQNVMARYGGGVTVRGLENVENVVNDKLVRMRRKHAITLEHLRMGALKGDILDADGSSLLNLFTTFGVPQKIISFALGNAATDVLAKCIEMKGYLEDNLQGETMTHVHALCSPTFFAALVAHPKVGEAYKYYQSAQAPLREDLRTGFVFGGIVFEEYRGSASQLNEDGTYSNRKFVPDGEARFFPIGTTETFQTYFAPADILGEVNTAPDIGTQVYAATARDLEFDRWVKIHTQSNPLPLCKRPALLAKGTVA